MFFHETIVFLDAVYFRHYSSSKSGVPCDMTRFRFHSRLCYHSYCYCNRIGAIMKRKQWNSVQWHLDISWKKNWYMMMMMNGHVTYSFALLQNDSCRTTIGPFFSFENLLFPHLHFLFFPPLPTYDTGQIYWAHSRHELKSLYWLVFYYYQERLNECTKTTR